MDAVKTWWHSAAKENRAIGTAKFSQRQKVRLKLFVTQSTFCFPVSWRLRAARPILNDDKIFSSLKAEGKAFVAAHSAVESHESR